MMAFSKFNFIIRIWLLKMPKWATKMPKWATKTLKLATCCSIFVAKTKKTSVLNAKIYFLAFLNQ